MGGYLVIDSPSERIFSEGAQMDYVGIDHHRQYSHMTLMDQPVHRCGLSSCLCGGHPLDSQLRRQDPSREDHQSGKSLVALGGGGGGPVWLTFLSDFLHNYFIIAVTGTAEEQQR